jgi:NAD(P)-dependent dehydrogenase (short-subunit alcohol dehydrogenase family)
MVMDFSRLGPAQGTRLVVLGGCGGIGRVLIAAAQQTGLEVANLDLPRSLAEYPVEGVHSFEVDAHHEDQIRRALAAAHKALGGIDALVHLAGYTKPPQAVADLPAADWDDMISVNLRSAYLTARHALPLMRDTLSGNERDPLRAGRTGAMVFAASGLGVLVERGISAYGASKAGVIALTKALAKENAPAIRANAVAPGAVDTAFLSGGMAHGGAPDKKGAFHEAMARGEGVITTIPQGRIARAEEVAAPILFLLGEGASHMTGQTLFINGGRLMPSG